MRILVLLLGILFGAFPTFGQSEKDALQPVFSPGQLQEDFALSRQFLETLHPALYDFVPKDKLNQMLDSVASQLGREMTALEFFRLLSPIVSGLGCGHTGVGLPTRESGFIQRFFPFGMAFLDSKAYIVDGMDTALLGAEVLSVNGKPMDALINELFRHISTDGTGPSNRYMYLDNKFDIYYGLHVAQPDTFRLLIRTPAGSDSTIQVPAAFQRIKKQTRSRGRPASGPFPFSIDVRGREVAVLTINMFYMDGKPQEYLDQKYRQFLDSCFVVLKRQKTEYLIIDVRQNAGGYGTWGAWLFAYLARKPFRYYEEAVVTTNKDLPFIRYTDWKQEEYAEYVKDIVRKPSGEYRWTAHSNLQWQQPQPNSFAGPVYILIGRKSFSTTAEFCAIAHSNKRAVFIGEETGGGYYSINGGDMVEMILPNSKIKLAIPMRKYLLAVREGAPKGRGTLPDYPVTPTIQQFLKGEDVEMECTLKLIRKRSSIKRHKAPK